MNKAFLLLFLLFSFTSLSLHAYSKRIILISLSTQEGADAVIKELPTHSPTLYALALEYNFKIKLNKSGKYYIVSAEVFTDKKVLNIALKKIRKRFKGAYVGNYKYPKVIKKIPVVKKKIPKKIEQKVKELKKEIVIVEKIPKKIQVKKIQKVETKKVERTEKIEVKEVILEDEQEVLKQNIQTNKEDDSSNKIISIFITYFEWSYLVIFILAMIMLKYYIKFKRIYDEY
ncbi:MAG: hypothetical protein ACI9TV_002153 [Sulfurimonas sp.]|jgi:hypothetical protein|uniref:hypothetical protein n=1 Tax=Sulfurimonas sp. TaxID=2022749 RepID=UPI0039E69470